MKEQFNEFNTSTLIATILSSKVLRFFLLQPDLRFLQINLKMMFCFVSKSYSFLSPPVGFHGSIRIQCTPVDIDEARVLVGERMAKIPPVSPYTGESDADSCGGGLESGG